MARRLPTVCFCLLAWCASAGVFQVAHAQTEAAPRPSAGARAEAKGGPSRDDLRYLYGRDGRLIPVLDKAAYDEFLRWQETREHPGPPVAAITRVRVDGTAESERVLLTVRIDVTLSVEDEWVAVPLALTEAQLTAEVEHAGPGDHNPGVFDPQTGLSWWLRGKGRHELTVRLQTSTGVKPGPRRLVLSLPSAALSTCRLRIPAPRINAKASDRATLTSRVVGQETELEIVGTEGRLDLAWQVLPPASTAPALLEVNTSIALTLVESEGATLEASQRIQTLSQQAMIEKLRVRIPQGTQLLRLEGTDLLKSLPVADSPGLYEVHFKKPVLREVELRYTLHAPPPAMGEPFVLDGFDVESASAQSGHVAVTVVGDLRAVRDIDSEKFVHRVNVSDLPTSLRQPQTSLAFRYFKRLRLSLHFEPVAPQASVEPESSILIRPGMMELVSLQKLQVRRGSLGRFAIRWPGRRVAGWSQPTIDLVAGGEVRLLESQAEADDLVVEAPEPLTGNVVLRIRSQRALTEPRDQLESTLPVCDFNDKHSSLVALYTTEDVEARLEGLERTQLRPAPAGSRTNPPEAQGLFKRDEQIFEPADGLLTLWTERHQRRANSRCVVDIQLEGRVAKVVQRFDVDVEYAPLDELRLLVPQPLEETPVDLQLDGAHVHSDFDRQTGKWRLPVDPPRTGRIVCEARFAVELPADSSSAGSSSLPIPLLTCDSAPARITQIAVGEATGVPASVVGDNWRRQISPTGSPVWIQDEPVDQVDVSLPDAALRRALAQVSRACLKTVVGGDGTIRTRAQYRVVGGVVDLSFRLPAEWRPVGAWWNSQAVVLRMASGVESPENSWIVSAPEQTERRSGVVTIDLEAPAAEIQSLGIDLKLAAPILPSDRIPAETIWELTVPEDQYLMTRPAGFAPAYRWLRSGFGWRRIPLHNDAELRAWIGTAAKLPLFEPDGEGHSYLFHTTRGEPSLEVKFMNRLPLVLLGSGGVLLAGLLITRLRRLHSLPVAVAAAAAAALAAVGWTETVLTLLQPALLGGALLLFYLLVDLLVQRGRIAEPQSSATFPMAASTIVPYAPPAPPGSHDVTSIRSNLAFAESGGRGSSDGGNRP